MITTVSQKYIPYLARTFSKQTFSLKEVHGVLTEYLQREGINKYDFILSSRQLTNNRGVFIAHLNPDLYWLVGFGGDIVLPHSYMGYTLIAGASDDHYDWDRRKGHYKRNLEDYMDDRVKDYTNDIIGNGN